MASFDVIPALDVLEGRCVRLSEGRREHVTIEGGDPAAGATRFVAQGAKWLHVVDLDGAFSGRPTPGLVEQVVTAGVPVQIGGGLRDIQSIEAALESGAARTIIGSAPLTAGSGLSLTLLSGRFTDRLVIAIDAKDGKVVVDGWVTETVMTPQALARECADAGVQRLLVTATRRDGSLAGPDLELLGEVLEAG